VRVVASELCPMVDGGSLQNFLSDCVCSGVRIIYQDGSTVTPFLCYQGASGGIGTYRTRDDLIIFRI